MSSEKNRGQGFVSHPMMSSPISMRLRGYWAMSDRPGRGRKGPRCLQNTCTELLYHSPRRHFPQLPSMGRRSYPGEGWRGGGCRFDGSLPYGFGAHPKFPMHFPYDHMLPLRCITETEVHMGHEMLKSNQSLASNNSQHSLFMHIEIYSVIQPEYHNFYKKEMKLL